MARGRGLRGRGWGPRTGRRRAGWRRPRQRIGATGGCGFEGVGADEERGQWVAREEWVVGEAAGEQRGEEIAFQEADAAGEMETLRVVVGDSERGGRDVDRGDRGALEDGGERDGDGSGACADVDDLETTRCNRVCDLGRSVGLGVGPVEDGLDEVFGFGAGDEDVRGDAEVEAEEFLSAGDVLQRLLSGSASDESAEGFEVFGRKVVFGVGEEPGAVVMESVGEEGLGVAASDGGGGFEERVAESHCEMSIAGWRCDRNFAGTTVGGCADQAASNFGNVDHPDLRRCAGVADEKPTYRD